MHGTSMPFLRREFSTTNLAIYPSPPKSIFSSSVVKFVVVATVAVFSITTLILSRESWSSISVPFPRPFAPPPIPQFIAEGESQCLPPITEEMIEESLQQHALCRKYSPFMTGRARVATVTAHFGTQIEHYKKAFQTHLLHSLIHGTEVRVMCDTMVDALWNKPAFILDLLMREMMKSEKERLEWIMWVDRDTMILDQCRPITSFLPPEKSHLKTWWNSHTQQQQQPNTTAVNLLVTNDFNGLNNGIFLIRVNQWAVSLFTAILAFRHFKPDVELQYTEQSAMEIVLHDHKFKHQTRFVPQHWFNAYDRGGPLPFLERTTEELVGLKDYHVRRGDYLVHFAGHPEKDRAINEYWNILPILGNVWKNGTVQRDVSENVRKFWERLGY